MNRRKPRNQYHQFRLLSEHDHRVHEWQFSRGRILFLATLSVLVLALFLFFSADYLTQYLYRAKLRSMQRDYAQLSTTLLSLKARMNTMSTRMVDLEEKDRALRTYANLPQVDEDVRKLGIGGKRLAGRDPHRAPLPDLESKVAELEMDVDALSRKVKLELASYGDLYDQVQLNQERMKSIPSLRPVKGGYLNSSFGYRRDPFVDRVRFHYGLDITLSKGSPVYAPADGVVKYTKSQPGYGKVAKIDHGHGYTTIYAHLSQFRVRRGQRVKRGDVIATSGSTGRSTAPHLHYEVHRFGTPQNPLDYFFSGYLK